MRIGRGSGISRGRLAVVTLGVVPTAATGCASQGGYNCFRIPAIVRTKDKKTMLAFAEGRKNDCDDTGAINVVLKRSTDGGKSWGRIELVADGAGDTRGNPVPIVDRVSGRITLLTTHNPGPDCGKQSKKCTRTPYLQHSTDAKGTKWSAPKAQPQLKQDRWNTWFATGPGHGLQLTRGPHKNRMVVGITFAGKEGVKGAALIYSDDRGTTWKQGATDDRTGKKITPQELNLLETVGGAVYATARNQDNNGTETATGNRAAAVSVDAGASFQAPFAVVPDLKGPVVQGSVVRLRAKTAGDPKPDPVLRPVQHRIRHGSPKAQHANPHVHQRRQNLARNRHGGRRHVGRLLRPDQPGKRPSRPPLRGRFTCHQGRPPVHRYTHFSEHDLTS